MKMKNVVFETSWNYIILIYLILVYLILFQLTFISSLILLSLILVNYITVHKCYFSIIEILIFSCLFFVFIFHFSYMF